MNRRLVEPRVGLDFFEKRNNLLPLPEFEPGIVQLAAYSLSYLGSLQ